MRIAALVAMVAGLIAAAPASAATFCVPAHAGCTGTGMTLLSDAVDAANLTADSDDIYLASGFFPGGVAIGSYPVHIHGAGQAASIIEGGGGPGGYGVDMAQPESSIEDLTIHELPGGHATGLRIGGSARGVRVDVRDNGAASTTAVELADGGSFADGSALAVLDPATTGISAISDSPLLISNVQVRGGYGMRLDGSGPLTVRFAKVVGTDYGIENQSEDALIEDSLVSGGPLVGSLANGTTDVLTTVRHVTLNGTYLGVDSSVSGHRSRMVVSNTAVVANSAGPDVDVHTSAPGATARLEVDYSLFRPPGLQGTGAEYVPGAHNDTTGVDPRLVDLANGDLRPQVDSPLVDTGDPVPGGGEPPSDLAGGLRAVNGRTDIGAYEYGRHAPTLSVAANVTNAVLGSLVSFSAGHADLDPGEAPVVTWAFDDGTTATGDNVTHAFATIGTHTATATATDAAGLTAAATVPVFIFAPVVIAPPVPPATRPKAPGLAFTKLKAIKGVAGILLRCPPDAKDCTGTLELQLGPKGGKVRGAKVVVLGNARYLVGHGQTKAVAVKLTRNARAQLKRARKGLRVKVVVRPDGAATVSRTVTLRR
jgi:PKD repeat protein